MSRIGNVVVIAELAGGRVGEEGPARMGKGRAI